MNFKFLFKLVAILGLVSSQVCAGNANVGTYNLILKNDLSTTSDIEGRLLVGGNINANGSSLDVGSLISANPLIDAVTVVGNINANDVKTQNGNIVYGGTIGSTSLINNGTGTAFQDTKGTVETFNSVWESVERDSAYFANLEANASFSTGNNQQYLEASTASELSVYEIKIEDINKGDVHFRVTPNVPVVINVDVTGESNLVITRKASFTNESDRTSVLWNFFSTDQTVTHISFNGDGWRGSVLAPYANITSSTGALEGGVAALSYNGRVELHNDLYTYTPPTPPGPPSEVPTPASLGIIALALLLMVRRKLTN